jgi:hypothetical protein
LGWDVPKIRKLFFPEPTFLLITNCHKFMVKLVESTLCHFIEKCYRTFCLRNLLKPCCSLTVFTRSFEKVRKLFGLAMRYTYIRFRRVESGSGSSLWLGYIAQSVSRKKSSGSTILLTMQVSCGQLRYGYLKWVPYVEKIFNFPLDQCSRSEAVSFWDIWIR